MSATAIVSIALITIVGCMITIYNHVISLHISNLLQPSFLGG